MYPMALLADGGLPELTMTMVAKDGGGGVGVVVGLVDVSVGLVVVSVGVLVVVSVGLVEVSVDVLVVVDVSVVVADSASRANFRVGS